MKKRSATAEHQNKAHETRKIREVWVFVKGRRRTVTQHHVGIRYRLHIWEAGNRLMGKRLHGEVARRECFGSPEAIAMRT